jgi:GSH-dependent disulfide-bond oxidoreductase
LVAILIGSILVLGKALTTHKFFAAVLQIEYAIDRFTMETKRQLDVLDKHLADNEYMVGDEISIADFAIWPWILCCFKYYGAEKFLDLDSYTHLKRWYDQIGERPAVKRGGRVNGFGPDAIAERHSKADFDRKPEE